MEKNISGTVNISTVKDWKNKLPMYKSVLTFSYRISGHEFDLCPMNVHTATGKTPDDAEYHAIAKAVEDISRKSPEILDHFRKTIVDKKYSKE